VKRLWVQLALAFALSVLLTVATIALLVDLTAGHAFRRYLSYSDSSLHQALSERLIAYYQVQGSWQGVESVLGPPREIGSTIRSPMLARRWPGTVNWPEGPVEIVLADGDGQVIYDRQPRPTDRALSRDERAAAHDLELNGQVIGKLVIAWPISDAILGPLEQGFVNRLRWLLVAGGLLAGGMGILLGLAISRNLTAPLQRLASAARAVANRDFSRRVEVEGSAELAEVAQAFNEMASGLEQSERQRQNMVADVAHELRSPLSILQGNIQAILDDVYPLDKAEISRLYDETRLLSRLVEDLRDLALADAGQLGLNLQATDLASVVAGTADSLVLASEAQEVHLAVQLPGELPTVQADPQRLAQVLRNLLINALRHTPPGGSVTVLASPIPEGVEVAVTDTGEGIAPEDLSHVFDRFWRADPSRARTEHTLDDRWSGGSGLGLSVARSLVEAHGGRIWAESELGWGSVFRFTFPSTSDPESSLT
jgi:two-component system OmpR family sensor kinase